MQKFDILSYHPGRQHNIEQAIQLQKSFKHFRHATSFYFDKRTVLKWETLSTRLSAGLDRRSSGLEGQAVDTYPFPEARLLLKRALGYKLRIDDYIKRNRDFQEWMLRNYAPPKTCIGFDTASWVVFEKWKHKSLLVLDLSIAPPQYKRTLAKENDFDETFIANQTEGDTKLYHIYSKELELADLVLCGSEFVKNACLSLGVDAAKLNVIPYGADLSAFCPAEVKPEQADIIKVAFIGSVNYRKGADVLLNVWPKLIEQVPNIELHFYGNVQIDVPVAKGIFCHGFLPQKDLIAELRTAQLSVLPTFFEGSSLAIYQSMAMGLAVITTPNAGSVIKDGRNGLLVPYGSAEALYKGLYRLITEPALRKTLALHASEDIRQFTWDTYGKKLNSLLKEHNVYEKELV